MGTERRLEDILARPLGTVSMHYIVYTYMYIRVHYRYDIVGFSPEQ